ncbi:MAG: hypothetical protein AVDCRST_MAG42-2974 [uncultured Chthoniobacterales bacterium]|uniref:Peptidase C-terminal archaeal/bacterial domain-containing protein n=1 Tax=uncultured Chthoniobacterales bacterium TaxID=1836801 RepID=A0A6J4IWX9_9BACT|nr:MAG: hypothetical protein AVDCRST_MAG42-2974 [uncultured Chthoniobacterales bacterium]
MTSRRIILFALTAVALAPFCRAQSDNQVEARKVALDLAGAFANEGFKVRDGHWTGTVKKGDRAVVAVNLYAGNEYWFSVAGAGKGPKFSLGLYDENGKPLETEQFAEDEKAATGFSPTISGQYFVSIAADEGDTGTLCLVYSYK